MLFLKLDINELLFMKDLKNVFTLPFFISVFLVTSCQSDSVEDADSKSFAGDYWPTAIGNQWISSFNGNESAMKIISSESVNGQTYYKFNEFVGVGEGIMSTASYSLRKENGEYYIKMDKLHFEQGDIKGEITPYEFLFLKDYLDINKSWTGRFTYKTTYNSSQNPTVDTSVDYTGTILEKGISLAVKGVKYKDVIKFRVVQQTIEVVVEIGEASAYTSYVDYWVSKNIGIIKMATKDSTTELLTYSLK